MQTGIVGSFDGYQLYATTFCSDMVQARKHKKKRINKKWLKRYGMKSVPWKKLVLFDGKIYGHPTMMAKLIEMINLQQPVDKFISTSPMGIANKQRRKANGKQ